MSIIYGPFKMRIWFVRKKQHQDGSFRPGIVSDVSDLIPNQTEWSKRAFLWILMIVLWENKNFLWAAEQLTDTKDP